MVAEANQSPPIPFDKVEALLGKVIEGMKMRNGSIASITAMSVNGEDLALLKIAHRTFQVLASTPVEASFSLRHWGAKLQSKNGAPTT